MRYKKKELLQMVSLLDRVNQIFRNGNIQQIKGIVHTLPKCQTVAVELGTYLETLGEETKELVSLLESYCEKIYQLSIYWEEISFCKKMSKKIQKQLNVITHGIRYSLPADRIEILFLPYKAAMWDSMESVWRVVKEDTNCDVSVVPIPYYDKNPDGSFGKMHYEIGLYPVEVPVIDWQEYLISDRRPDVIFIHNPYDEYNKVTSVPPSFYSSELKKDTNCLIYIPYFVTKYNIAEHFAGVPGIFYADYIIVQSRKIRKRYLEYLTPQEEPKQAPKFAEKFLALGSPKFDKVVQDTQERYLPTLPVQWRERLYDTSGRRRKVILYNTSLQELLNGRMEYLDKLEESIQTFARCESVVLIWRPHPLTLSTLEAMLPELQDRYRALIESFQCQEKDIYDDTPDLHRAIALSDAYYGDGGSLLSLYGLTGKAILRQRSYKDVKRTGFAHIFLNGAVIIEDAVWFFNTPYHSIFKFDLISGRLERVASFRKEFVNALSRICDSAVYGSLLIFAPDAQSVLYLFDRQKQQAFTIQLKEIDGYSKKGHIICVWKNTLFCIGKWSPYLIGMDLITGEIIFKNELYKDIDNNFKGWEEYYFHHNMLQIDNMLYCLGGNVNIVCEYNLEDHTYKMHHVGKSEDSFAGIVKQNDLFYLVPRFNGDLIEWNSTTGAQRRIRLPFCSERKRLYGNYVVYGNELFLYPFTGKCIVKYSFGADHAEVERMLPEYDRFTDRKVYWAGRWEDKILYFTRQDFTLHIEDMETKEQESKMLICADPVVESTYRDLLFGNRDRASKAEHCINYESPAKNLERYILWVTSRENTRSEHQKQLFAEENCDGQLNCGEEVYKLIKQLFQ